MYRTFRVFSNGELSFVSFLLIENQQLKLELFCWPKKRNRFGYRVRLDFVHHGLRPAMDVNVSVFRVAIACVMDVTSTTVAERCLAFPDIGQEIMLTMRMMYRPIAAR